MKNSVKILTVIFLTGVYIMSAAGCEKQTKHKVLTFFFTGVPPIDGEKTEGTEKTGKARKRKRKSKIPQIFVHGPKASGECFFCHDTESTLSFQRVKKGRGGMPRLGDITPGRLVVSRKEICTQCHTSKSSEFRYTENLWVHGPLADGMCTSCHDYHQTRFRYMLFKESSIDLCTQCHAKGFIKQTEDHKSGEECISCHNPHVGANRLLLRKDFNEVF